MKMCPYFAARLGSTLRCQADRLLARFQMGLFVLPHPPARFTTVRSINLGRNTLTTEAILRRLTDRDFISLTSNGIETATFSACYRFTTEAAVIPGDFSLANCNDSHEASLVVIFE